MRISAVAKAIVAGVFAVLGVVAPLVADANVLTVSDFVQMTLGVLAALGVYVVPNRPSTPHTLDQS